MIDPTEKQWPPQAHGAAWGEIARREALRTADEGAIRAAARAAKMGGDIRKPYLVSPIAPLISRAFADLLFGEEVRAVAADENNAENLARIMQINGVPALAHQGAQLSSALGEVWIRVSADREIADAPVLELFSRAQVAPVFTGRFLREATIIHTFAGRGQERYRLMERHAPGVVESRLFKGSTDALGDEVALDSYGPTAGTMPVVQTGIDRPLIVRVANGLDADPTLGVSDYLALAPLMLALNEALTIAQHNFRLTGAKRLWVDRKHLDAAGNFNLSDDILIQTGSGVASKQLGDPDQTKAVQQTAFDYEATQQLAHIDWLLDHILTAAGVSPASVGRGELGGSLSGTALRLRMAHTLSEVAAKGRYWDAGLAEALRLAQLLDAAPVDGGGFGRPWSAPEEAPEIIRGDGLPPDAREEAQTIATLAGADAVSMEERVRQLHPAWDDARVGEEVARIQADAAPIAAPDFQMGA